MTATLNGRLCSTVRATLPRYGVWSAWVTLATADAVATTPGGARLEVAGLVLVGTVKRQGERAGLRSVELEGGHGGWSRPVPATGKGGGLIAGNLVRLEAVASSIALAAGERVSLAAGVDRKLGEVVAARLGAVDAGALLSQACASPAGATVVPWWVDVDGTTRLGARTGAAVTAKAVDVDDLARAYSYAEDDALQLLPGATIDGSPIVELRIEASGTEVREVATVAVGEEEPHTFAALVRRLVLRIMGPQVSARTLYRYIVRNVDGNGRIRATPVRSLLAPTLDGVRYWPGVAGARCTPKVNTEVLLQFADGDPVASAACITNFAPADIGSDAIPEQVEIDGDEVVLAQGTLPCGRGGATLRFFTSSSPAANDTLSIEWTDPDGGLHSWAVKGAVTAAPGPVIFTVFPGSGLDMDNVAVTDAGRAEVLV